MKYIFLLAGILGLIGAASLYLIAFKANTNSSEEGIEIFIDEAFDIKTLANLLHDQGLVINTSSFNWTATLMSFKKTSVKPGRYLFSETLNNRQLISILRSGRQSPVNITFNNVRDIEELAGRITNNIQLDSLGFLNEIQNDDLLDSLGFNNEDILTLFIPNTYEVFWNISFESLINRMESEHNRFWTKERLAKAEALKLNPKEVYTLASIVEKETIANSEKKRIAGVYYNRLERDMLLQADPTVVFANGDFEIRRVLNKHLEIDSPYNTYKYLGLPPGPIYMPDINSIDAVLNKENHKYLFFCAKADNSGLHAFAETSAQHAANARRFHNWLNKQRIYK